MQITFDPVTQSVCASKNDISYYAFLTPYETRSQAEERAIRFLQDYFEPIENSKKKKKGRKNKWPL